MEETIEEFHDLINVYLQHNVLGPRYNSYPALPHWNDTPSAEEWLLSCRQSLQKNGLLSLYIHIPFCEKLCTFCACNTYITQDHSLEKPYLDCIHKEFAYYCREIPELKKSSLLHLHLGGGTPNFFSPKNLARLLGPILEYFFHSPKHVFSIEADMRHIKPEHLSTLYDLGFREIQFGLEDVDPAVQQAVNKKQSIEQAASVCQSARKIGYRSLGLDLIYGLPHQSLQSITDSIKKVTHLKADRLAYYGYTHVPWIQASRRLFSEKDLPQARERIKLYLQGRKLFQEASYKEIGMDHYAREHDPVWLAAKKKHLHRSFIGYRPHKADLLLGLGVSAVSESPSCYRQNERVLRKYQNEIEGGRLSAHKGHKRSAEDIKRHKIIESLGVNWEADLPNEIFQEVYPKLKPLEIGAVKLIQFQGNRLKILPPGRPLLRKICMSLDSYILKVNRE